MVKIIKTIFVYIFLLSAFLLSAQSGDTVSKNPNQVFIGNDRLSGPVKSTRVYVPDTILISSPDVYRSFYNRFGDLMAFEMLQFVATDMIEVSAEYTYGNRILQNIKYGVDENLFSGATILEIDEKSFITGQTMEFGFRHINELFDFNGKLHLEMFLPVRLVDNKSMGQLVTVTESGWHSLISVSSSQENKHIDLYAVSYLSDGTDKKCYRFTDLLGEKVTEVNLVFDDKGLGSFIMIVNGIKLWDFNYSYTEYDEYGNWVTCIKDSGGVLGKMTFKREIEYYW